MEPRERLEYWQKQAAAVERALEYARKQVEKVRAEIGPLAVNEFQED